MPHTFLYISLPLFCTTTIMPFCTTSRWNFLVTHYSLWRNCRMYSRKILLLVFLFAFFFIAAHFHLEGRSLLAASISHFPHRSHEIFMFFFQRNSSPLFLITHASSFSVIQVSADVKNNVEKDSTLLLLFFLSPGGHAISRQKQLELPVVSYLLI